MECNIPKEQFSCDSLVTQFHALIMDAGLNAELLETGETQVDFGRLSPKLNWSEFAVDSSREDHFEDCYDYVVKRSKHIVENTISLENSPVPQSSRLHQVVFMNVLKENDLISREQEIYYESILDIWHYSTFGATFYLKLVTDLDWYADFVDCVFTKSNPDLILQVIQFFDAEILQRFSNVEFLLLDATILNAIIRYIYTYGFNLKIDEMLSSTTERITTAFKNGAPAFEPLLKAFCSIYRYYFEQFMAATFEHSVATLKLDNKNHNYCENLEAFEKLQAVLLPIEFNQSLQAIYQKFIGIFESLLKILLSYPENNISVGELWTFKEIKLILGLINFWKFVIKMMRDSENIPNLLSQLFDDLVDNILKVQDLDIVCDFDFIQDLIKNEKPGYRFAIVTLIMNGDPLNQHTAIFKVLTSEKLAQLELLLTIARRLQLSDKIQKHEKTFFADLFHSALSKSEAILHFYGKLHLHTFETTTISDVSQGDLLLMFNKVPVLDKNSKLYKDIKRDVKGVSLLDPLGTMNFIFVKAICGEKRLLPFVTDLFNNDLYDLCCFPLDVEDPRESLLAAMINYKLNHTTNPEDVAGIIEFIKSVKSSEKRKTKKLKSGKSVLPLESVFYVLISSECLSGVTAVRNKILTMKLIVTLSEGESWASLEECPAPFLYYMLQFIDFYWWDGSKKEDVLLLLNHVMQEKLIRKLTLDELLWIVNQLTGNNEDIILLAYLEPCLPLALKDIFEINESHNNELLVLSAIAQEHGWMLDDLAAFGNFLTEKAVVYDLSRILRFLTKNEWKNVFRFLTNFFSARNVLDIFCLVIATQTPFEHNINTKYAFACIGEVISEFFLSPKNHLVQKGKSQDEIDRANFSIFRAVAKINYAATKEKDCQSIAEAITMKVAKSIEKDGTNLKEMYTEQLFDNMHPNAQNVFVSVFGEPTAEERKTVIKFTPI